MAVWGLEDKTSGPAQLAGGVRPREEPRQEALILGGFFLLCQSPRGWKHCYYEGCTWISIEKRTSRQARLAVRCCLNMNDEARRVGDLQRSESFACLATKEKAEQGRDFSWYAVVPRKQNHIHYVQRVPRPCVPRAISPKALFS